MRYRDLETGVWLSRDPAGFVDGPNLYAYVVQNPWSKFDPDGLEEKYGWQTVEHRRNFNNFYEPLTGNHGYATQITRTWEFVEPPQDDYGAIANLGMEGLRSGLAQQFGKASKMAETVRNMDLESLRAVVEGVASSMNPLEKASSALDAASTALSTAESAMNAPAGHRGGIAYAAGEKSAGPLVGMILGKLLKGGAASDMTVVKPGTKEWDEAVEALSSLSKGKMNIRTRSATDAKRLLKESRGNMDRRKQYTDDTYKKGYETHNDQNKRELDVGNDLQHLKWKDGKAGGHIYYKKPN
jgi:hypothetical protein